MMFSATVAMLLMGVGAAIDFSNMSRAQNQLQAQVDAGVLAAALVEIERKKDGSALKEKETRIKAAHKVIEANGFDMSGVEPKLNLKESSVELTAEVKYKPAFGGILGINSVRLEAIAESGLPGQEGVDIVLVLDNTESMRVSGKMDALKDGAVKLIDAVETSGSDSKVGLVPFARYVRINDNARTASWFDMPAEYDTPRIWQQATHTGGTCSTETRTRIIDSVEETYQTEVCTGQTTTYEERTTVNESRWDGCVGTRMTPYSERDGNYTNRIPGLLNKVPKEVTGLSRDTNSYCPAEIMGLTDNYDSLRQRIQSMWTTDSTYIPIGLSWGERVLSPGEPYDNKPLAGGAENRKVLVLMTDGENTTEIRDDKQAEDEWRAPPYISIVPQGEEAVEANAATARMCESIKASGTEIYTIAFQVNDSKTKTMLEKCASGKKHALTADSNTALVKTFEKVASAVEADIRLMR